MSNPQLELDSALWAMSLVSGVHVYNGDNSPGLGWFVERRYPRVVGEPQGTGPFRTLRDAAYCAADWARADGFTDVADALRTVLDRH